MNRLHFLLYFPTSAAGRRWLKRVLRIYVAFWVFASCFSVWELSRSLPSFLTLLIESPTPPPTWLDLTQVEFNAVSEITMLALAPLLVIGARYCFAGAMRRTSVWLRRAALHTRTTVVALGLFSFMMSAAISISTPLPPHIHDEFSHVMVAETLALGRIASPTHPHWQHFETFFFLHQPRMMSHEPPGLGAIMTLGIWAVGKPIAGMWLATALAVAAVCWMLQGWLPPRWALLGGALAACSGHQILTWGQSYWGGNLSVACSAIVVGALPRLWVRPSARLTILMGAALVLLANVRPFEGLCFAIPIAAALGARLWNSSGRERRAYLGRVLLPTVIVLGAGVGLIGLYNHAATGNALLMPHVLYHQRYVPTPSLFVMTPPKIEYPHRAHAELFAWYLSVYHYQLSLRGFLAFRGFFQCMTTYYCFAGLSLLPALAAIPWLLRCRGVGLALLCIVFLSTAMLLGPAYFTHYFAPAWPWVMLLAVQGWRGLRLARWNDWRWGRLVANTCAVAYAATFVAAVLFHVSATRSGVIVDRPRIIAQLEALPDKHLVFVEAGPQESPLFEWVYNHPDIDQSRIVWARPMDDERNATLTKYFADRRVWRLWLNGPEITLTEVPKGE